MRYFVPDIRLAAERPSKTGPVEKFGGLPWGLAPDRWPSCSDCVKSQSFLAQFQHAPERLDLGKDGRILYVFQCNHEPGGCETWEGGSGANACFVLEPENSTHRLSSLPDDEPLVENEAYIVGWIEFDDGIPESEYPSFFQGRTYFNVPDDLISSIPSSSKLGSVPCWLQSPDEAPSQDDGWRFIGQLDSTLNFMTPPNIAAPWVLPDSKKWEGRTHYADGPNFGDGGIAYLFIRPTEPTPEAWFFWQCG